jgi:hypothetical protein
MEWIKANPIEALAVAILVLEQALPHLPVKANSTLQVLINIGKLFLRKTGK